MEMESDFPVSQLSCVPLAGPTTVYFENAHLKQDSLDTFFSWPPPPMLS